MKLLEAHTRSIGKSAVLSVQQVEKTIPLADVIEVLNGARISFVLVGAHGLSAWTRKPRATEDVDVVVAEKHLGKATRALLAAFPHLETDDQEVVIRLRDKESREVAIDLMKPRGLYRQVFKHLHPVEVHGQSYRVPRLEMALTMKFAAMVSPNRRELDKHLDLHDFGNMVLANAEIDDHLLFELGEQIYGGGGAEILDFVQKVRAGEKIVL